MSISEVKNFTIVFTVQHEGEEDKVIKGYYSIVWDRICSVSNFTFEQRIWKSNICIAGKKKRQSNTLVNITVTWIYK